MPAGQNKVILEVLIKARAETAAMNKAKGSMKGLGNATKRAGKDMHHFRIITADTQRRIGALRNVLLLLKFAMATLGIRMLVRQLGGWVKAWAAQEQAVNRLNVALAGVGRYTEKVSKDYQKMAADMQRASVFGDEAIMEVMQTLMTLGNVADKDMRRATQAVLDFSSATGRDLAMATLLVAKAAVGYTGELSRYGIMIDKSLSKTEKFAATLEFLAKMKDRAKAETFTLTGAVKQLGNTYGDAKEKIGKALTEATNLVPALKLMNEWIVVVAKNTATSGEMMLDLGNAFIGTLKVLNMAILYFKTFFNIIQVGAIILNAFAATIAGIANLIVIGFTKPLKIAMQVVADFLRWIGNKTIALADMIADIPFEFPFERAIIKSLDAIGAAFKGGDMLFDATAKALDILDKDATNSLKNVQAVIKSLPADIAKNAKDMLDAGASYNKMAAEIDELEKKYPKLKAQLKALTKALLDNKIAQLEMTKIKNWNDALKAAGKYYKLTYSEEQKLKKQKADIAIASLKDKLEEIKTSHKTHLEKIKNTKEYAEIAERYSGIETEVAIKNAKVIARINKQLTKDKEADWIKEMRSIKKLGKLTRSEEIANRKEIINTWATRQWEMTGKITADMPEEEVRAIMKQRKELIDKLGKYRAEAPLHFAKAAEADWKKGMKAAQSYYKLTRSEEIANRREALLTWKINQEGMAETKEEIAEIGEAYKRMLENIPREFPVTFEEGRMAGWERLLDSYKEFGERIADMTQSIGESIQSSLSGLIADAWGGELKTAEDYYRAFNKTIIKIASDAVSKEIMLRLFSSNTKNAIEAQSEARRTATVIGGENARTAAVVTGEAKQAVAVASASTAKIAANTAEASSSWYAAIANFIKAHSWIPYVGVALAGAAIGAAVAMMSKSSKMFAKGGIVTSRTNAVIGEAGPEAVVPLKRGPGGKLGIASYEADNMGNSGNGNKVTENHYYINAVDARSFVDLVRQNPSVITEVVNKNIKYNGPSRQIIRKYATA